MRELTFKEKGALLIALGEQVMRHELRVAATVDGNSDKELTESMTKNGVDGEMATQILESMQIISLAEFVDDSMDGMRVQP